jgi:putative addiction module component (TIGR02574 family)
MTLTELPQVQALSAREKLRLVDEIWSSVGADLDSLEVTHEEAEVLDKRWADFLKNPAMALTTEELKSKVHAVRA